MSRRLHDGHAVLEPLSGDPHGIGAHGLEMHAPAVPLVGLRGDAEGRADLDFVTVDLDGALGFDGTW